MQRQPTTPAAPASGDLAAPRSAVPRRRLAWRKWLVVAAALLALRLALPLIAAPLLASRLSRALGTRVEIGDVTLQPLDAVLTLRDVAVYAPGTAPDSDAPAPVVAERARLDLQYLPLLHRTLRVRELALESARIELDRLPEGDFRLAGIEHPTPTAELPAGWVARLDRITLRDSTLRVRDLAAGGATLLEAMVRRGEVSDLQRRATAFGRATNLRVDADVGGGRLMIDGVFELRDDGLKLDAKARVVDVPLAHLRSYAAAFGWSDVSGEVSGRLRWQREPRRRDLVSGRAVVRRAAVQVAGLEQPAFAARRADVAIAAIDLRQRRITVESLSLRGATLALQADLAAPIPLLTTALQPAAPRRGAARGSPAVPWSWTIERFDSAAARLRLFGAEGVTELRAHATGENLGPAAYWSPLRIDVRQGDLAAHFDGSVRFSGTPTVEGRLTATGLDAATVARGAGLPWAGLVRSGHAALDLTVGLDTAASDGLPFYARGGIAVTDLWLAGDDPGGVVFTADSANLTLAGFSQSEARRTARGGKVLRRQVTIADAELVAPALQVVRQTDGRVLAASTALAAEPPADGAEIVFKTVRGSGGRLTVVDLGARPPVTWQMVRVSGAAQAVTLPRFGFERVELRGADRRFGDLQLVAMNAGGSTLFELSAANLPLAAVTPYLAGAGLPYRFEGGTASVNARGALGAAWSAEASLALREPALVDGDAALEQALGMPIAQAMTLLRGDSGAIELRLPLAARGPGTQAERVAAAVREAISGARQAAANLAPVSVLFPPGQTALSVAAMEELTPLARLLSTRPDLIVGLSADTSRADRQWLAEQALRVELAQGGGLGDVLRAFGMRTERDRIEAALSARARGAPGLLDPADEAALQRMLAQAPPVEESKLAALREARMNEVARYLADAHGIALGRIVTETDVPRGIGLSSVRAQLKLPP